MSGIGQVFTHKKDGIEINPKDIRQPYRIYIRGVLVAFCKTKEEADQIYVKGGR